MELELLPFCRWAGLKALPWGPLGAGFLSGRYERGAEPPAGSRIAEAGDTLEEAPTRRAVERNFRAVDEARALAGELGATIPQVAIAWLLHQPGVTAPIVGPRTLDQLDDLLGASELRLSDEQVERLGRHTRPPDMYPYRLLREQNAIDPEQQRRRR